MYRHQLLRSSFCLAALLGMASVVPSWSDDRDLLKRSEDNPYVFVILDVSGSMNWQPAGDAWAPASADDPNSKFYQAKSGLFRVLQATDDINFGFATYNQDGLQVTHKHFLYRLADGQPAPPWVTAAGAQFNWPSTTEPITFGPTFGSNPITPFGVTGTLGTNFGSCSTATNPVTVNVGSDFTQIGNNLLEERGEFNRFPKLGWPGSPVTTQIFFRHRVGSTTYNFRMDFSLLSGTLGSDTITVRMRLRRIPSSSCTSGFTYDSGDVDRQFVRYYATDNRGLPLSGASSFIVWERDADVGPSGEPAGYFQMLANGASNTCAGWDSNTDSSSDQPVSGYNLRHPTVNHPAMPSACSGCLNRGDVIPLEWDDSVWLGHSNPSVAMRNRDLIMTRLAPNLITQGMGAVPDFRQSPYFRNSQTGGRLTLLNANARPLIASGATPIGASMNNFLQWFQNWRTVAAANDPRWGCKSVYLLIITDGDETCNSNPAQRATDLMNLGVETYVVGYGLAGGSGNTLIPITCNGGGQAPDPDGPGPLPRPACSTSPTNDHLFMPNSEDELVNALLSIFSSIREKASAFAAAAAPTLQANVADKVVISTFTPLDGSSVWPSRVDAFLKPVPVTGEGKPDTSRFCGPGETTECLVWDAGDSQPALPTDAGYQPRGLLLQAPQASEIDRSDPATLQIGLGDNERRVFYSQFASTQPGGTIWVTSAGEGNRRWLTYPTTTQESRDLFDGMGISFTPGIPTSEAAAANKVADVIEFTLQEKTSSITDPDTGATTDVTFLLGDVFHANPTVIDQPGRFDYYTNDPYVGQRLCGVDPDPDRQPPVSYRWFADKHLCRRKMLAIASNDGQLHFFDAGMFEGEECLLPTTEDRDNDGQPDGDGDPIDGRFNNGTGREIFSFVPRPMLRHLKFLQENNRQEWGLDNTPRVDDVFIDPNASTTGSVACLEREWRTVLIGSYREGGSGYFALDITQPDEIDPATNIPEPAGSYVPSCTNGGSACGDRVFPYVLWEFYDTVPGLPLVRMDEDLNGWPDLGETWSVPATGRIRVCNSSCDPESVEDRYVAIFGGGLGETPSRPTGNFVYMVDIETGKVLWKHQVVGSVPADVTAIPGGDGYIKYLYFGTTAGRVYKVIFESGPMRLANVTISTLNGAAVTTVATQRLLGPAGDTNRYRPFEIFRTNGTPVYYEIAAIWVQRAQKYALAFGTGNRWDLWQTGTGEGRFYVILDTGFVDADRNGTVDPPCGACPAPLVESAYQQLLPGVNPGLVANYLTDASDPTPGWYLRLDSDERVISEAFALSGITIFVSFQPDEIENPDGTCSRTGTSRLFIVGTLGGTGYWFPNPNNPGTRARYFTTSGFQSAPFVERGATGNQSGSGSGGGANADRLTESLQLVRDELRKLFPPNCRFGNYTQNIKSLRQDTRITFIAPIPICIEATNFKEF